MSDTTKVSGSLPSGRFVLRIKPELHGALRDQADACGLSLNEYCARRLAAPGSNVTGPSADAVSRAISVAGDSVLGIIAFGSWARDETGESSDVDLLVIVEPALPITRELYREWDQAPLRWGSHRIEPNFVRMPDTDELSGLWAEAAVDGIVLFERGLEVSRRLAELRREIASGRILRREASGQPYWVEAD